MQIELYRSTRKQIKLHPYFFSKIETRIYRHRYQWIDICFYKIRKIQKSRGIVLIDRVKLPLSTGGGDGNSREQGSIGRKRGCSLSLAPISARPLDFSFNRVYSVIRGWPISRLVIRPGFRFEPGCEVDESANDRSQLAVEARYSNIAGLEGSRGAG